MANIKSRLKAPKSASAKRGRRNSKRSLTGANDASDSTSADNYNEVMKRPSLKSTTTKDKVQLLIQNGHLKDKFTIKSPAKNQQNKLSKKKSLSKNNGRISKDKLNRQPPVVVNSRSGRLAKKSSENLKFIDKILKKELMIGRTRTRSNSKVEEPIQTVSNNNEIGISDQNELNEIADVTNKSKSKVPSPRKSNTDRKKSNSKNTDKKTQKNTTNTKSVSKTKQVTLSNGLVLTLTLFQCDYCQKMFSSKSSLRRHIYGHLKIKPHTCKKCSKKFRYKVHLKNHMANHHLDKNFLCQICNKTFSLEENLELHLSSHVKNENSYKCIYCDKKFSYNLLLVQHEKQHLVTGRYQCTVCSMSYDCRNRLSMHMKTHLKIKDYICQHCGKEFLRMNSMRRHVQICHGGHRIQCPICKKKLKGHLTEHMRLHKQARPHECEQCGQRFTQSTQLTVHKRCHTGARPYLCRICNGAFTHSNALLLHIRRHTGEKPFPCAMCPMSFSQLPHMKAHMRKIHGKENPYKCPNCDQFFKLKTQVESHAKTCAAGEREFTFEESIQASVEYEEIEVETVMSLSRMRFLLALLLTMIATKEKLKFLGFNKRLIDDLLVESLEAMGQKPCKNESLPPLKRLKTNIQLLLNGTVPKDQMAKFVKENKTTEELLELLTDEKKKDD